MQAPLPEANRGRKLGSLPQVLWPNHRVQRPRGADLHRELDVSRAAIEEVRRVGGEIESAAQLHMHESSN